MKRNIFSLILIIIPISTLFFAHPTIGAAIIADHNAVGDFDLIPQSAVEQVKTGFKIFYGHTSHGSQLVTGMSMLQGENSLFGYNSGAGSLQITEYGDDLGLLGDTSWAPITRQKLNQGDGTNLVIWSWCGGCTGNTEDGINAYLNTYSQLEQDYPNVIFIYMTGHLDGSGPTEGLYTSNNQIRQYCTSHDKILFDFADIESYDPDGNYYPNESDGCSWCSVWCGTHSCPTCGSCAHSHCFNCYQKGKAIWWLLARIAGWNGAAGIGEDHLSVPESFSLRQNAPNPFNPATHIEYSLPGRTLANIAVYNLLGQQIKILLNGSVAAGNHSLEWDGTDSEGKEVASGIYFYQIQTPRYSKTMKMVLIR